MRMEEVAVNEKECNKFDAVEIKYWRRKKKKQQHMNENEKDFSEKHKN